MKKTAAIMISLGMYIFQTAIAGDLYIAKARASTIIEAAKSSSLISGDYHWKSKVEKVSRAFDRSNFLAPPEGKNWTYCNEVRNATKPKNLVLSARLN